MAWEEVFKINSNMAKPLNTLIEEVKQSINSSNAPLNEGGVRVVKSVQHIEYIAKGNKSDEIIINSVNTSKSLIINMYGKSEDNSASANYVSSLNFKNSNTVTISVSNGFSRVKYPLAVVEFY